MKNKNLYKSLEKFSREAIDILKQKPNKNVSIAPGRRMAFVMSDRWGFQADIPNDFDRFFYQNQREILLLPSAKSAGDELKKDNNISKYLGKTVKFKNLGVSHLGVADCLVDFLLHLFSKLQSYSWNKAVFNKALYKRKHKDFVELLDNSMLR